MLAALLLNIPNFSQHGPSAPKAYSTSWNPKWSEMYGPDAQRKRTEKETVKKAVAALKEAEYVPEALQEIKEIVHSRSLVDELNDWQPDTDFYVVYLLEAYFFYLYWRKRMNKQAAMAIVIME